MIFPDQFEVGQRVAFYNLLVAILSPFCNTAHYALKAGGGMRR